MDKELREKRRRMEAEERELAKRRKLGDKYISPDAEEQQLARKAKYIIEQAKKQRPPEAKEKKKVTVEEYVTAVKEVKDEFGKKEKVEVTRYESISKKRQTKKQRRNIPKFESPPPRKKVEFPKFDFSSDDDETTFGNSAGTMMRMLIGAIGIGIVLMVGYIVLNQVREALPSSTGANVTTELFGNSFGNTVFAGVGLVAVGIIIIAAFGLVNIFRE